MNKGIKESVVEQAALDWLCELGYEVLSGLAIAPGEPTGERTDYKQVFSFWPPANQAGGFESQDSTGGFAGSVAENPAHQPSHAHRKQPRLSSAVG